MVDISVQLFLYNFTHHPDKVQTSFFFAISTHRDYLLHFKISSTTNFLQLNLKTGLRYTDTTILKLCQITCNFVSSTKIDIIRDE